MWVIDWLPDWLHLLTAERLIILGIFIWIFSKFLSAMDLKLYAFPLEVAGIVMISGAAFLYAGTATENKWKNRGEQIKEIVVEIIKEVPVINTKIETKLIEETKYITVNTETIRTEIQIEKEVINADCKINDTALSKYNRALAEPVVEKEEDQ